MIYDVRKGGDVIGELCASEELRPDRAVALEETDAICVPFEEVMQQVLKRPDLIAVLVDVFCRALKEAYAQVNSLAIDDTVHRLIKVLISLATKIGRRSGFSGGDTDVSHARGNLADGRGAPRASLHSANSLRRRGMVQYSTRGHLILDVSALELHSA